MNSLEWDSPEGRRRVVGAHPSGKLLVATEGQPFQALIAQDKIEAEMSLDQRRLESHQRTKAAVTLEKAKAASAKLEHEDLDGFDLGMPPLERGKAIKVLQVQVYNRGEFISRRNLVRAAVRHGASVGKIQGKFALTYADGVYLILPKIAIDYASYLISLTR